MRHAFSFVIVAIAACLCGIGSAYFTIGDELRFQKIELGQWSIWPRAGDGSSDPYTKAFLARSGIVWMSLTEGLRLLSTKDDEGNTFNSRCSYLLEGDIPRGRLWTLTTHNSKPKRESDKTLPVSLTSHDSVWLEDGTLTITISKDAQPGNWLPLSGEETFELILRIYDTPLTSAALDISIKTPTVKKLECS